MIGGRRDKCKARICWTQTSLAELKGAVLWYIMGGIEAWCGFRFPCKKGPSEAHPQKVLGLGCSSSQIPELERKYTGTCIKSFPLG